MTSRAATLVGDTSGVSFPECLGHPRMATHIRRIDANGLSYLTIYGLVSKGSQKHLQIFTSRSDDIFGFIQIHGLPAAAAVMEEVHLINWIECRSVTVDSIQQVFATPSFFFFATTRS